jgi:hypothetical protein
VIAVRRAKLDCFLAAQTKCPLQLKAQAYERIGDAAQLLIRHVLGLRFGAD